MISRKAIQRKAIQQYCDAIAAAFKLRNIIHFGSYTSSMSLATPQI